MNSTLNFFLLKANSHQAKANVKSKKIKEQSEEIKEKKFRHHRKIALTPSLSMIVYGS